LSPPAEITFERETTMTQSETARHARAELETIAAGLRLHELARLVALGRRLLEQRETPVPEGWSAAE
jgi:hypothetical protein